MTDKTTTLHDAVARFIRPGSLVAFEGFGHLNPVAASHEVIRQRITGLKVAKMTADPTIDQFIAAGVLDVLITSFVGNSSGGSLHELRRSVEGRGGHPVALEEYSHGGMVARYLAGAWGMPFFPVSAYRGSDIVRKNPRIQQVNDPYSGLDYQCVPPLKPDVTVIHAQRADRSGNVQAWGIVGVQTEAALAAENVVVTVEEIVPDEVVRSDPSRTVIPSHAVSAVAVAPMGAYPASCQGYYDRDDVAYREWSDMARYPGAVEDWLHAHVHAFDSHLAYTESPLFERARKRIQVGERLSGQVNYGRRLGKEITG